MAFSCQSSDLERVGELMSEKKLSQDIVEDDFIMTQFATERRVHMFVGCFFLSQGPILGQGGLMT